MSDSICSKSALAQSAGDWYFLNKSFVTIFTLTSVHCAERIVEIKSWSGFLKFSAILALGYDFFNICQIFLTRSHVESSVSSPSDLWTAASFFSTLIVFFFTNHTFVIKNT